MRFLLDFIYFKRKGYTVRNACIAADVQMSRPKKPTQPFVPRVRERGEAMPYDINTKGKKYRTEKHNPPAPMRPGADDHARYVSRGF